MLEFQRAKHAVCLPANDDERAHEARHDEVGSKLGSVPNLTVFGFQSLSAFWIGVDLCEALAADGFCWV
ncbi:hypothetical protein [Lignipirellula cremea]|uniref:Uncharacterized protein n=1 Tax=Lignipirellula cremea TaxID=2528010 RepID=A0A518DQG4_9BACT|nr:hypothetical protein [Lignipirellula cremea]QDU94078.1 hypothetical protein Pla8534_18640 [Lignipirellula cremea]